MLLGGATQVFLLFLAFPLLLDLYRLTQVEGGLRLSFHQHKLFGLLLILLNVVDLFKSFRDIPVDDLLYFGVKFPVGVGN